MSDHAKPGRIGIEESSMRIAAAALAAVLLSAGGAHAQPAPPQDPAAAFMAQNATADGVRALPSGVQYKVLTPGPGTSRHPTPADYVTVTYEGALVSGQVFDKTGEGNDATFQLKGLIPGWIDVMQQMQEGDEWLVWVPPSLGYGARQVGPIPANSVLVFKLKLVSILGG
jgi:peptidylprolyl isomerase/FKBP-type peptidyl-prolyl cis-trans isomerase FklB